MSATAMSAPSLPVLSYAVAKASPELFARQLQDSLSTVGFIYLDDIQPSLPGWRAAWDTAFADAERFFALPQAEKDAIHITQSRHFRGYSGVGSETTQGKSDLREQIDLGPDSDPIVDYPPPAVGTPSAPPIELSLLGPNLYPTTSLPDFETTIRQYRSLCEILANDLIRLIAASLTPQPELIVDAFTPSDVSRPAYSRMKVARYPPVTDARDGAGVGAHRDGGGLTLLAQDNTGGLQVQAWDGSWIDVTPRPYALVLNVGQVVENLSSGTYPSTTHRVLPTPPTAIKARLSIPFFFCPPLDAILTPLMPEQLHPELVAAAKKRAEVVSAVVKGDLIESVFGRAAWRGMTRSQEKTWRKWYGPEVDALGGPDPKSWVTAA